MRNSFIPPIIFYLFDQKLIIYKDYNLNRLHPPSVSTHLPP